MKPPLSTRMFTAPVGTAAVSAHAADERLPFDLLPDERVLWTGHPRVSSFARQALHAGAIALYFGVWIVVRFYQDRSDGASVGATLRDALPLALLGGVFVLGCWTLARGWARTSRYFVTSERCVLHVGMALTATLSLPWARIASVSLAVHGDGSGDIALAPKRPHRLRFVNLWPHVRPWRIVEPEPMLRCVPDAARVTDAILAAMRARSG